MEAIRQGRISSSKIDNSWERCQTFRLYSLWAWIFHSPLPLQHCQPQILTLQRIQTRKIRHLNVQTLQEKYCILVVFLSFMQIFGFIFINFFSLSRKGLMREEEVGNRKFGRRDSEWYVGVEGRQGRRVGRRRGACWQIQAPGVRCATTHVFPYLTLTCLVKRDFHFQPCR